MTKHVKEEILTLQGNHTYNCVNVVSLLKLKHCVLLMRRDWVNKAMKLIAAACRCCMHLFVIVLFMYILFNEITDAFLIAWRVTSFAGAYLFYTSCRHQHTRQCVLITCRLAIQCMMLCVCCDIPCRSNCWGSRANETVRGDKDSFTVWVAGTSRLAHRQDSPDSVERMT